MSSRPTWHELTDAACTAYAHGYAHGLRDARRVAEVEAQAAELHARAADVVRAAAQDIGTPAASRPRSRGVAA
ncbi:hypothetical protein [Ornithinimicrobium sp. W1665]|uniref:hypothetical protein n=1 Tax=Ornithinimicrobium sp. W1665 TaxID=3416666 RepID=UPI003CF7A677